MSKKLERQTVSIDHMIGELERKIDGAAPTKRTCSRYMYCV